jgi:hypothetical protein
MLGPLRVLGGGLAGGWVGRLKQGAATHMGRKLVEFACCCTQPPAAPPWPTSMRTPAWRTRRSPLTVTARSWRSQLPWPTGPWATAWSAFSSRPTGGASPCWRWDQAWRRCRCRGRPAALCTCSWRHRPGWGRRPGSGSPRQLAARRSSMRRQPTRQRTKPWWVQAAGGDGVAPRCVKRLAMDALRPGAASATQCPRWGGAGAGRGRAAWARVPPARRLPSIRGRQQPGGNPSTPITPPGGALHRAGAG